MPKVSENKPKKKNKIYKKRGKLFDWKHTNYEQFAKTGEKLIGYCQQEKYVPHKMRILHWFSLPINWKVALDNEEVKDSTEKMRYIDNMIRNYENDLIDELLKKSPQTQLRIFELYYAPKEASEQQPIQINIAGGFQVNQNALIIKDKDNEEILKNALGGITHDR